MKKYKVAMYRRESSLTNNWYQSCFVEIEARTERAAENKLDKLQKKYGSPYCKMGAELEEITE